MKYSLKCLPFNTRGLKSKINVSRYELCYLHKLPDILVITET